MGHARGLNGLGLEVGTHVGRLDHSKEFLNITGSSTSSGHYPGLVNISGTYCFLNSTLQVSQQQTWHLSRG